MRIIMPWGPTIRDDGGPRYIQSHLNRIKDVRCDRFPVTMNPAEWGEFDAVLYIDWSQDSFGLPLPAVDTGKPTVLWLSDTHMSDVARQNRFEWGHMAGPHATILFYHPEAVDLYLKSFGSVVAPQRVEWLPAAAEHRVYTPPLPHYNDGRAAWPPDPSVIEPHTCVVHPTYDLAWVGHVGDAEREAALDTMFRAFPNFTFYSGIFFEQAAREFHKSAIVFNKSVRGDLNMRTFEALATRSFLLTDRQRGMGRIGFQDGVHGAIYDSLDEAIDKARFYLRFADLRRKIADQGWRWCLKSHTYWHRARTFLTMLFPEWKE